jgi:hypothetical protein
LLLPRRPQALWNAVFLPANAAVIELYPRRYYEAMFQNFVRMTGKFYFKTRLPEQTINGHNGHYLADIGDVLRLVTLAHDMITNTETLRTYPRASAVKSSLNVKARTAAITEMVAASDVGSEQLDG